MSKRSMSKRRLAKGILAVSLPLIALLLLISLFRAKPTQAQTTTPPNFKAAFIGDSGAGSGFRSVLTLIKNEGTDVVVHQGDFAYQGSDTTNWEKAVNDILGSNFPYFGSVGNHDSSWSSSYAPVLAARAQRVGAQCSGKYGQNSVCIYKGLVMLLSGGATGSESGNAAYIRDELAKTNNIWEITSWHHNQEAMQVGGKGNSVGWGPYEEARKAGAILATAHEHSYQRTKTLTSTQNQTVDSTCSDPNNLCVAPGRTFVFVSGLGGKSIRVQKRCFPTTYPYGCNKEWASIYTSDQGAEYGALFIEFYVDGNPNRAHGYFKNIKGKVIDDFFITKGGGSGPTPTKSPTPTPTKSPLPTLPGDIDKDGDVDIFDYNLIIQHFGNTSCGNVADINGDCKVDIFDYNLLVSNFGKKGGSSTPTPGGPTPTPGQPGPLDQTVCYPPNGPFSLNINNRYLPFPVGLVNVIESSSEKVQISVLNQTQVVWGVTTRVIEEREWLKGKLNEVSRNFFVQSPNGTVCYYGEDVFDGSGNPIGGAWRAGKNGARAGIMMPPAPAVGQTWIIEDAAKSGAYEDAVVTSIGKTFVTPAGTFKNTLHISEDGGKSQKDYAPGIGMIFDDGLKLTSYTGGP